jgi:hypothetical protein
MQCKLITGFPGKTFRRMVNRNPDRCSNDRTIRYGFVFRLRIRAITAYHFSMLQISML